MGNAMPRASILIPTYNAAELTLRCLESIHRTVDLDAVEVVVCDDASSDDTDAVLDALDWARVLHNPRNLGFAATCNRLAAAARAPVLVFCNDDVEAPEAGWLSRLLEPLSDPEVAICGARLLFPDGTLQHDGVEAGEHEGIFETRHRRYREPDPGPGPVDHPVAVTAAVMAVRRTVFECLDGFDTAFVNGNEDVDFCLRAAAAGWRTAHVPEAVLVHHESQSPGRFDHVGENIALLHRRWHGSVRPEFLIRMGLTRRHPAVAPVLIGVIAPEGSSSGVTAVRSTIHADDSVILAYVGFEGAGAATAEGLRVVVPAGHGYGAAVAAIMEAAAEGPLAVVDAGTAVVHEGWIDQLVAIGEASPDAVVDIAVDTQMPSGTVPALAAVAPDERARVARSIAEGAGVAAVPADVAGLATTLLPAALVARMRDRIEVLRSLRTRAGVAVFARAVSPPCTKWWLDTAALSAGPATAAHAAGGIGEDVVADVRTLLDAGLGEHVSGALSAGGFTLSVRSDDLSLVAGWVCAYARTWPVGAGTLLVVRTCVEPALVEGSLIDALGAAGLDPTQIADVEVCGPDGLPDGLPDGAARTGGDEPLRVVDPCSVPLTPQGLRLAAALALAERHRVGTAPKATVGSGR